MSYVKVMPGVFTSDQHTITSDPVPTATGRLMAGDLVAKSNGTRSIISLKLEVRSTNVRDSGG